MVKKLILIFLAGFISFVTYAQQQVSPAAQPVVAKAEPPSAIKVEEEFDFGKIPQGKPVHHRFKVQNVSVVPLKIGNVVASCGCTTPEWEKDASIAPGASTDINVGYNAAAEGAFHKTISITYNNNQTKVINIKGEVWKAPAASVPDNEGLNALKDQ